ncbi:MAG: hypothetical protein RL268_42 [Pseudomonadota bacterium]|jgi:hypothetical protein
MTAVWPSFLPAPEVDGYSIQPQAAFVRTDMDQGPARQRRRFTTAPTLYPVKWILTEEQMELLEAWYDGAVDAGAAWFLVTLRNGRGLQQVEARFIQPWQAGLLSGWHYEVSATLEVRNRPLALAGGALLIESGQSLLLTEAGDTLRQEWPL